MPTLRRARVVALSLPVALALPPVLVACSGGEESPQSGGPDLPAPPASAVLRLGDPTELAGTVVSTSPTTLLTYDAPKPAGGAVRHVELLEADTLEPRWDLDYAPDVGARFDADTQFLDYGGAVLGDDPDDPVLVPFEQGSQAGRQRGVTALDVADGSLLWQWLPPASSSGPDSKTAVVGVLDDVVVVRTGPDSQALVGRDGEGVTTWGLDAATGAVRWRVDDNLDLLGDALVGGSLVGDLARSRATVVDPATGRPIWTGPRGTAAVAAAGRWLVVTTDGGRERRALVDLDDGAGELEPLPAGAVPATEQADFGPLIAWTEPPADPGDPTLLWTVSDEDDEPTAAPLDADADDDLVLLAATSTDHLLAGTPDGLRLVGRDGVLQTEALDEVLLDHQSDYLVSRTDTTEDDPPLVRALEPA